MKVTELVENIIQKDLDKPNIILQSLGFFSSHKEMTKFVQNPGAIRRNAYKWNFLLIYKWTKNNLMKSLGLFFIDISRKIWIKMYK